MSYFAICILMPTFNGFINGYSWSGYALHYTSMGWPLARSLWWGWFKFRSELQKEDIGFAFYYGDYSLPERFMGAPPILLHNNPGWAMTLSSCAWLKCQKQKCKRHAQAHFKRAKGACKWSPGGSSRHTHMTCENGRLKPISHDKYIYIYNSDHFLL